MTDTPCIKCGKPVPNDEWILPNGARYHIDCMSLAPRGGISTPNTISELQANIAKLLEALRPFASWYSEGEVDRWPDDRPYPVYCGTTGQFRRAARAIKEVDGK